MRKPSLSAQAILEFLKSRFGNEVTAFSPLPEGDESQAWRFVHEGRPLVIRVNRSRAGFEKDAFAYQKFAHSRLPIPEVIDIGQIDDFFYCISEYLPGTTLQDLCPHELPGLLEPAARVLESIAQCDISGITGSGLFTAQGAGDYDGWRDFLMSAADPDCCDWSSFRSEVDMRIVDCALDRVAGLALECPEIRALIHGDFGSNNVLAHGDRISGVLDWSDAMIGDPLWDVANIFFWRTCLDCMEQQAAYFEQHLDFRAISGRMHCYQIRIGLDQIYSNLAGGNAPAALWAQNRCRQVLS